MGGTAQRTVLEYLGNVPPENRKLGDVVAAGYKGCLCVETGGPEPGVGCAGRGIISAFGLLADLDSGIVESDVTLYDVLGDVVCGGFAVPLRNDYADTVYVVTSGEFMSIYAANNILRGTANYNPDRIGGIVFNSRGDPEEDTRVEKFSRATGIPVVVRLERSPLFMEAEKKGKTVVECFPESGIASSFRSLAHQILKGKKYNAKYLPESELEKLILGRESVPSPAPEPVFPKAKKKKPKPYPSENRAYGEPIHGCAFSGASSVCTSVTGLSTVLHAPRSCAHFTVQLDSCNIKGARVRGYETVPAFEDPDVVCTDMTEETMVFGGNGLLCSKIEEGISEGKTDFAVITACPPGIIGDDSESAAAKLEHKHPGVKIAVLGEDGNAAGDFMQGVVDAGIGLLKKFAPGKRDTRPFTVNLVGVKTVSSSAQSELKQVKAILSELGIGVNCVMPGYCTLDELKEAPAASADLKLNPDRFTDRVCGFLEDQYGIPTLEVPVRGGLKGTVDWIGCVASFFGREERGKRIIEKLGTEFDRIMEGPRKILGGKRCCILTVGGDTDWITESIEKSGMILEKAYILRRSDYNADLVTDCGNCRFETLEEKDVGRAIEEIESLHPDIFLVPASVKMDPDIYQSRLPCAPATEPFAGKLLADDWIRGILAPKEEGWRKDVA